MLTYIVECVSFQSLVVTVIVVSTTYFVIHLPNVIMDLILYPGILS